MSEENKQILTVEEAWKEYCKGTTFSSEALAELSRKDFIAGYKACDLISQEKEREIKSLKGINTILQDEYDGQKKLISAMRDAEYTLKRDARMAQSKYWKAKAKLDEGDKRIKELETKVFNYEKIQNPDTRNQLLAAWKEIDTLKAKLSEKECKTCADYSDGENPDVFCSRCNRKVSL